MSPRVVEIRLSIAERAGPMYVSVSRTDGAVSALVADTDTFTELAVRVDDVGDEEVSAALSAAGLGTVDGEHVWLDTAALRAAGAGTPEWTTGYEAMLRYASSKGWTDDDGTHVRAHITRT